MKALISLLITLILAFCIFGGGAIYYISRITPETLSLGRETAQIKAETAKIDAQQRLTQTQVQARMTLLDLQNAQEAKATRLYLYSLAAGYALRELWVLWLMASAISVAYTQRARFTPQVEFAARGIETRIPAQQAVMLIEKALKVEELEISQKIISAEAETRHDQFKDTVSAIKTIRGMMPKKELPAIDVTPAALPAFSGNVYYSQLIQDAAYEDGLIPYGREMETGNLVQIGFKPLQSVIKLGLPGFGKSMATKAEILTAFNLKFRACEKKSSHPIRLHVVDLHHNLDDALTTELKPYLSLFDTCILGADAKSDNLIYFLDSQIADAEQRQKRGLSADDPTDIIIFDEFTATVEAHPRGKEIEEKAKELLNLHKARKFLSIIIYDSSKQKQSAKGMYVAKMGCSKMVFNTDEQQAALVLGWGKYTKGVESLTPGQCILRFPQKKEQKEITILCQMGIVVEADWQKFLPFVKDATAPAAAGFDLKAIREQAQLSQAELGKLVNLSQMEISRLEHGTKGISVDFQEQIAKAIKKGTKSNVVPFKKTACV